MSFESSIQQWVSLDNQLKLLNEKIREVRDKKNHLTENLIKYAITNDLTKNTIPITDGKLKFINTRIAEPLTFKYLEKTLKEVIKNESQVSIIMERIREKREIKITQEIKRL
jgi:hypothetical protein